MTSKINILVTGAGGKTGGATVRALLNHKNVQVRAMVRKDDHRARALREMGAKVVIGNMEDIRDVRQAMRNVQRAYLMTPMVPNSLDQAMNFAYAAQEAKLEHVVLLGQWLSSSSHPSILTRRQWLIDRLVSWIPDVNHTIINVGWFADNYMATLGTASQLGIFPMPIKGNTAPIDHLDIGRVAAGVLVNPAPYKGRTLRPTGPKLLTPQQVADAFGEVLERKVQHKFIPEKMLSKSLQAAGADPFYHAQVLHYVREYHQGSFEFGAPSDVVLEVTGSPAEDFTSIVRRYVAEDRTTQRSFGNKLRAILQMIRTMWASPFNIKKWEAENNMPFIEDHEECVDSNDWQESHAHLKAYWMNP